MTTFVGSATLSERLKNPTETYKQLAKSIAASMRVCMPGVVVSFDPLKQTCEIDLAVYDRIAPNLPQTLANYSPTTGDIKIPTLVDVPVVVPRGGGVSLTFPITAGDECLVVFADMCYNEWFDAGGIDNVQQVLRRHDLSDAIAIMGVWSQPRTLAAYSSTTAQLRTDDGSVSVGVDETGISLDGPLKLTGVSVPSVSSPSISLPVTVNGVSYYLKLSSTP